MYAIRSYYAIKYWPAQERPREKLLRHGPERLSEAELLALILRSGDHASRRSALDQGRHLLSHFENLASLARACTSELCAFPGIGPAKAAEIQAVFELARRLASEELLPGATLQSAADVFRHLHARLLPLKKERFLVLMLDCKHRIVKELVISEGCLTSSIVHPLV